MTELRTLKDIYIVPLTIIDDAKNQIRSEAVKWIKDLDEENCPVCKNQGNRSWGWCESCDKAHVGLHAEDIKEWIMHFFNITEEELK